MPINHIPIICDNPHCRTVFFGAFGVYQGTEHFMSVNNKVGPCPNCGGVGHTLDGMYSNVDGDLQLEEVFDSVSNMALRPNELASLLAVLKYAQSHGLDARATAHAVRERVSNAEPIARMIESRRIENIKWLVMFILGLLATIGAYTGPVRDWNIPNATSVEEPTLLTSANDLPQPRSAPTPEDDEDPGTPEPNDDFPVQ